MTENPKQSVVQIKREDVASGKGKITGALTEWMGDIDVPEEVFFLKPDEIEAMPAGTALLVKDHEQWVKASFYAPGEIKGPMVFAKTKIDSPQKALLKTYGNDDIYFSVFGVIGGLFIALSPVLFSDGGVVNLTPGDLLFGIFGGGIFGWSLKCLYKQFQLRDSDDLAIRKLNELRGSEPMITTLPKDLEI